jgi:hypothetical protein
MESKRNPDTGTIILVLGIGAAAYLVYQYLQSSGLWAQWFGGAAGNVFSDPQKLLAYCAANPTGTATYQAAGSAPTTAPCSQWIAAQQHIATTPVSSATNPNSGTSAPPPPPAPVPVSNSNSGLTIPAGLTVTHNINNSLSGNVIWNGATVNLSIITANAGAAAGVIYNTAGQDITAQFTPAQQQQLVSAFIAANGSGGGVSGITWNMPPTEDNPYGWEM